MMLPGDGPVDPPMMSDREYVKRLEADVERLFALARECGMPEHSSRSPGQFITDKLADLRRWIEEQECQCSQTELVQDLIRPAHHFPHKSWADKPCSRCLKVATWGGKTLGHPGLKKESEASDGET